MTIAQRYKRLRKGLGLTHQQMADIFGVHLSTAQKWDSGECGMRHEFKQTLLRLESDNLPQLSPSISPETLKAFYEGRKRALQIANALQPGRIA